MRSRPNVPISEMASGLGVQHCDQNPFSLDMQEFPQTIYCLNNASQRR